MANGKIQQTGTAKLLVWPWQFFSEFCHCCSMAGEMDYQAFKAVLAEMEIKKHGKEKDNVCMPELWL